MNRVGTLSSSIGLIFFGIWMILNQTNKDLAGLLFKCWPIIFIIIGLEILFYFNSKEGSKKVGFNPLIIFIILIFMLSNIFIGVKDDFTNIFGEHIYNNWYNMFDKRYEKISVNKTIVFDGDKINLALSNGSVEVKKSKDKNIKIEGNISLNSEMLDYTIKEQINGNQCNLDIKNDNIKLVDLVIYIPSNYEIKLTANNLKFDSNDEYFKATYGIDIDNGSVNIDGDAENIDIKMDNGKIKVNNKLSKNVNINMDNGKIDLKTEDKNVEIKSDIDTGISSINGLKNVNAGIKKIYGNGEGKINIRADHGTVNIKSQE